MIINPTLYQQGTKLPELSNPGSAADLLAGKQLVDQYGNPLTGTMPQRSAAGLTASGAAVTVPAGYYPSQVSKSVATATHPKPTISRSGGTVTANHVQSAGYTSGGTTSEMLTIPTKAGTTITPGTSRKTAVSSGYLTTGAVYVAGDSNLKAENIKSGVSIFGVMGSLNIPTSSMVTLSSILNQSGVIIWYIDESGQTGFWQSTNAFSNQTLKICKNSIVCIQINTTAVYPILSNCTGVTFVIGQADNPTRVGTAYVFAFRITSDNASMQIKLNGYE